ncbi:glycosyl hydrolase-related protein [Spiroplasma endosymbiont of Labia minor]|uniref:glycosyl hydrolase-related protein n=1 Tax=Spiroplasma endosymbiont of Labia minor TaxID=3066305 RepID=UPI0030CE9772
MDRFLLLVNKNIKIKKLNLELNSDLIIVVSTKIAEDKTGIIIRGFNSGLVKIKLNLKVNNFDKTFDSLNMLEETLISNLNSLELKPHEIFTIKIKGE